MRIAYVCADPGVPVFGRKGCSIHVQEVVRAFARLGHQVTLFARRWGGEAPADLAGLRCVGLPKIAGAGAEREAQLAAANRALPELLETHGPFDLVYERYALWSSCALQWARAAGLPGVIEVNAPLVAEQAEHRELHNRALAEAVSLEALIAARQVVAVSSGVARWLAGEGVDPGKTEVIANGVDAERFATEFRAACAVPVIGFVGTLKPWHGLEVLVDAAARLKAQGLQFGLLLVGDGPERAAIEAALAERGLAAQTELTGAVDPAEIPGLLARIDVAVAPYPDLEDFYFSPLKVMEYMAAGRAVVASRIGDIDGLVEDGVTGRLCPPGDAAALAGELAALIADPAGRIRLGRAARRHAEAQLGWNAVARRILALAGETLPC
jgi:glycosyltransferase involved in cell wall biosynthesis